MKPLPFPVLHHDEHLLAVLKPAGLPTVPDESGDASLFDKVQRALPRVDGEPAFVGVGHRIDRPVSGLVLLALRPEAAAGLAEQLRKRQATKVYWGVAEGIPRKSEGRLTQWLLKDPARNLVKGVAEGRGGAKQAVTRWRVLTTLGERALLELQPETGRSHQLRVAAAKLGCPLVGDVKYGASRLLKDRSIGLHARALSLRHPVTNAPLSLTAELPDVPLWNLGRRHLEAQGG